MCFQTYTDLKPKDLRNAHPTILVSHDLDDITDLAKKILNKHYENDIYFSICEFDTYEDAFKFGLLLKEGF